MKRILIAVLAASIIITLIVSVAFALPSGALPSNPGTEKAKEVSPAIDENTGEVIAPPPFTKDLPESKLDKVIFIRYAPGTKPGR